MQIATDTLDRGTAGMAPRASPSSGEWETVVIEDPDGRPVVRYDLATRAVVLRLGQTEVQLRERRGAVEIATDGDLRLHGGGRLLLDGEKGVSIRTEATGLDMDASGMALAAPALRAEIDDVDLEGRRVRARARDATFTWGRLHQVVGRLFDWAQDVYRRVDGVLHTRAGRVRTQAKGDYLLQARDARLHAREDVRVQGEQIHLG